LSAYGATAAQQFNQSQTGLTKAAGKYTASNSSAYGKWLGVEAMFAFFDVNTLPTGGNSLRNSFGFDAFASSNVGIWVNSSGVATVNVNGSTAFTFAATVTPGATGDRFTVYVHHGYILIAQGDTTTETVRDGRLYASYWVQTTGANDFYWNANGHGEFTAQSFEVTL
jgi:hypothetical protein